MSERATRVRYWVLANFCLLSLVLYLDRVCISKAAGPRMEEFGLSKTQMGMVFSAFTLAYGLFEVPTGYLGDRLGPKRVLVRIGPWGSVVTALTGSVRGVGWGVSLG